ncbi:MAG TPA: hypothetical protein VME46_21560 [Acidimicrobiales bacterium]|nr:hypothetical protein [Acidimicrobiales bacterium]
MKAHGGAGNERRTAPTHLPLPADYAGMSSRASIVPRPVVAAFRDGIGVPAEQLLALQQHVGNRAVAMVAMRSLGSKPAAPLSRGAARPRPPRQPRPRPPRRPRARTPRRAGRPRSDVLHSPALQAFLQRAVACADEPVAPEAKAPSEDPRFTSVVGELRAAATKQKAHPPVKVKVDEAQGAARGPADEVSAVAGANQAGKMAQAEPGVFDKAGFMAAVAKAVDAAAPKTPSEALDFKESGKSAEVKQQVAGMVTRGKDNSARAIKTATGAPPDAAGVEPKRVTPMHPEEPGAPPPAISGAAAMPAPRPSDETDLSGGPCQVGAKLAGAGVTTEQLSKGNEPAFDEALATKAQLDQHSATAPGQVKADEAERLAQAGTVSSGAVVGGLAQMHTARARHLGAVGAQKDKTKGSDEAKRAEVSKHIEEVFTRTRTEVSQLLDGLDGQVDDAFDRGELQARQVFDDRVDEEVSAWKHQRYKGIRGKWRWVKDKFKGLPDEVNQIYARNRNIYLASMQKVISGVADLVGNTLGKAKRRIAAGRQEIKAYIDAQPKALRQFAAEAGDNISAQFDMLDSDVESKQAEMTETLAKKYVSSRQAVDDAISAMQADNRGWVAKTEDWAEHAIDIIEKMKDMLMNVLSRVAGVVTRIVSDPIGFLGKFIDAVKGGLEKFVHRFPEHLQKGLQDFLFGALSGAGVELPETLDLEGILKLVLSVIGLTWGNIRSRIVAQVGEPAMAKMEQTVEVFKALATKGPGALVDWVVQRVGDLEDMVIGEIKEFVESKVIKAGIEWVIGLLNPAGAFIKACEAIYHIIMFFVEKGSQIKEFVDSVLDSVEAVLDGRVGAVADLIEGTLARMVPLIINFLADLLGLGGIGDKIREIIGKVQGPVNKAVDLAIKGGLKVGKKLFGGLIAKGRDAYGRGKQWAAGKVAGAKEWARAKWQGIRGDFELEGEQHSLKLTSEHPPRLLMASDQWADALARMEKEVLRAQREGEDQKIARAQALYAAVVELEGWARSADPDDPREQARIKARFSGVLAAIRTYEQDFGRRQLATAGKLKEGVIRPYDMQAKGGKGQFEREHILPGSVFGAWHGLDRDDPLIEAKYATMTTLLWKKKAANLKTSGLGAISDNAKWRQMWAVRDAWLARPEVAAELRHRARALKAPLPGPPAMFGSLDALMDNRVAAAQVAAAQAKSKVTDEDIQAAAAMQLREIKAIETEFRAVND